MNSSRSRPRSALTPTAHLDSGHGHGTGRTTTDAYKIRRPPRRGSLPEKYKHHRITAFKPDGAGVVAGEIGVYRSASLSRSRPSKDSRKTWVFIKLT